MDYTAVDHASMTAFKRLVDKHARDGEGRETAVKGFFTYKTTQPQQARRELYDSGIIILASGKKQLLLNGKAYDYSVGSYLGVFLPIPVEVEAVEASPENPILLVGLKVDLNRIAEMLLKLDRLADKPATPTKDSVGMFTSPLTGDLLNPIIRLLNMLDHPTDLAMLSEGIMDEIYYRILCDQHVSAIRKLLEQRGQIQQISRAVEHINSNLGLPVMIEDLAAKANMSVSHFHRNFKEVMQMSPLQYAKSMKLFKAQSLIQAGSKASQAAFEVGYNSTAQFSREYKRQFGITPSATQAQA